MARPAHSYASTIDAKEPILLWGFDFETQQRQDFTNIQEWGVCWLRRSYTNASDYFFSKMNSRLQQEVRHGNNITVLFKALFYCRAYYGHSAFWHAIALGFSSNCDHIKDMVTMLVEARKIKREHGGGKHMSDCIRAADDWIDFIDTNANKQMLSKSIADEVVYSNANTFYESMKNKLVNAANIPRHPTPAYKLPRIVRGTHQSPDLADRITYPRKRSMSPEYEYTPPHKRRQLSANNEHEGWETVPTGPRSMEHRTNGLGIDIPTHRSWQGYPESETKVETRDGSIYDSPVSVASRRPRPENDSCESMHQEANTLLKERNTALQKQLMGERNQSKDNKALQSVQKDISTLEDAIGTLTENMSKGNATLQRAETEISTTTKKVDDLARSVAELANGNHSSSIAELEGDMKVMINTSKDMSTTQSEILTSIGELTEGNAETKEKLDELAETVAKLKAEKSGDFKALQTKLDTLTNGAEEQSEVHASLRNDVTTLFLENQELKKSNKELKETVDRLVTWAHELVENWVHRS